MTSEHVTAYMASKIRSLMQFDSFVAEDGNFVVNSAVHR